MYKVRFAVLGVNGTCTEYFWTKKGAMYFYDHRNYADLPEYVRNKAEQDEARRVLYRNHCNQESAYTQMDELFAKHAGINVKAECEMLESVYLGMGFRKDEI